MRATLLFLLFASFGELRAEVYYRTFFNKHPVKQRIRTGEVVATKTLDSSGKDWESKEVTSGPNPLTGPFYVEGAEPGDGLVIKFHKVRLNRDWGYSSYRLALFAMTPEYIEKAYPPNYKMDVVRKGFAHYVPWDLDRAKGVVRLREPGSKAIFMEFPAKPMLGCVGVAAPGDWAPTSSPSGSYGGNLDYNRIGEGATVILPVYHPGALLFLGDGHALQGDGEPTGNGVETSMDVEFSVTVRKGAKLTGPRVETADAIISIGSQPEFQSSLDRALEMATTDMVQYLMADYGLEEWAAHLLIAFQGKYEVVTARGSMALLIPRSAMRKR
ncbi:MAG: acetamidase/formamidase family protein [Bryobacteraceae bacterium]